MYLYSNMHAMHKESNKVHKIHIYYTYIYAHIRLSNYISHIHMAHTTNTRTVRCTNTSACIYIPTNTLDNVLKMDIVLWNSSTIPFALPIKKNILLLLMILYSIVQKNLY